MQHEVLLRTIANMSKLVLITDLQADQPMVAGKQPGLEAIMTSIMEPEGIVE